MFVLLDKQSWENKPLNAYRYYIMGQICVAKEYRGQGLVEELYNHHKKVYKSRFDLLVTEIATRNQRSVRAHEKAGFQPVHTYRDELDEWVVVAWDWK
jgi:RimJ/RimL family protein N-acetyltransferase